MSLGRRRRRLIDSATAKDINRLLSWDCWRGEALERLAQRVEEAAHDDPPNGYALAMRCLAFLGARINDDDMHARALTAAGAAARRLGRAGEAGHLYERAMPLAREARTKARLWLSVASLALYEHRYEAAFRAVDQAVREGSGIPKIETMTMVMRGATMLEMGLGNKDQALLRDAANCFTSAVSMAEAGSPEQVSALVNLASALEAGSFGVPLQRLRPLLEQIRALTRSSRAKGIRIAAAFADWIEGRLALRLGSTREGIRRLRNAGQAFARTGCYADAIRVATDIVERGGEHGAEVEAYEAGGEVTILIPRDSPQRPALEVFDSFEMGNDTKAWAGAVRGKIAAG